ncbi:hypothetical protein AAHE18_05G071600 [Arachis hypogaea]
MSFHPGTRNKVFLLLTQGGLLLLLHVGVGSAVEASLLCSAERSKTSPSPTSNSPACQCWLFLLKKVSLC